MMNFLLPLFLAMSLLVGCQTTDNQRRATEQYYTSSGVEKFYLSDIPDWLNYSSSGQCLRQSKVRFMDLPKVMGQFAYSYPQALQFQLLLNRMRRDKMIEVRSEYLMLKDEEIVFYDAVDKIENGILAFPEIKFSRIHLIWIDPLLKSEEGLNSLRKLLASETMNVGYPILVSQCLDSVELEVLVSKAKLYEGVGRISTELFSVFSENRKHRFDFALDLSVLFSKQQTVHLYIPKGSSTPHEIIGDYKVHQF